MAAVDKFSSNKPGLSAPADKFENVTPDDATELVNVSRAVWVGAAGDITCLGADDTVFTLVGVQAGTLLPIRIKRVNATLTTATSIVAFS